MATNPLEARLAALEDLLGVASLEEAKNKRTASINSRLTRLEAAKAELLRSAESAGDGTTKKKKAGELVKAIEDDWAVYDRLSKELDVGGSILCHHQSPAVSSGPSAAAAAATAAAPLVYRRQEILSSQEMLRSSMSKLSDIRDLLVPGSVRASSSTVLASTPTEDKAGGGGKGSTGTRHPLPADVFVNSPIITSEDRYTIDATTQKRLHDVTIRMADVHQRALKAATQLDEILNKYHNLMMAASEKLVLAQEQIELIAESKAPDQ